MFCTGAWQVLQSFKPVWIEPDGAGSKTICDQRIQEYNASIVGGQGGIFFAVCRGKVRSVQDFPVACCVLTRPR
jgi:hypothetical protein